MTNISDLHYTFSQFTCCWLLWQKLTLDPVPSASHIIYKKVGGRKLVIMQSPAVAVNSQISLPSNPSLYPRVAAQSLISVCTAPLNPRASAGRHKKVLHVQTVPR